MKIECEYPFTDEFDKAYLVNSQGRNTVCLYSTHTKQRTSLSYARYLMSVYLGRRLTKQEQVDHINDVKDDDRIENLQILTNKENCIKHVANCTKGKRMVKAQCPICGTQFILEYRQISHRVASCCSRKCGGMLSAIKGLTVKKIILEDYYSNENK